MQSKAQILFEELTRIDNPVELFDVEGVELNIGVRRTDDRACLQITLLLVKVKVHISTFQLD